VFTEQAKSLSWST